MGESRPIHLSRRRIQNSRDSEFMFMKEQPDVSMMFVTFLPLRQFEHSNLMASILVI